MNYLEEKFNWFFENDVRLTISTIGFLVIIFGIMGVSWHNSYQVDLENSYTFEANVIKTGDGYCIVESILDGERHNVIRGCGKIIVGDKVTVRFFDFYYNIEERI